MKQLYYQVERDIEKLKKQNVFDIPAHVIKIFKDGIPLCNYKSSIVVTFTVFGNTKTKATVVM